MGDWARVRDDWELKVVRPSSLETRVVQREVNAELYGGWEPFAVLPSTGDILLRRRR